MKIGNLTLNGVAALAPMAGRDRSAVPRALLLVWRSVLRDGNGLDESAAV